MARKATTLAALDIVGEGLAQQDGLAERLARQRAIGQGRAGQGSYPADPEPAIEPAHSPDRPVDRPVDRPLDRNAWRRGKALLQVAIPEDAHTELSILAKRRRITLSHLVKDALNQWLDSHGHALRLPD